MSDRDDDQATSYGTTAPDAPVNRRELERALRFVNLAVTNAREDVLRLAAQVVALTDELTRRIDGLEPEPAAPGTPAAPPVGTVEAAVGMRTPMMVTQLLTADETSQGRVLLGAPEDKYQLDAEAPPCAELLHLCQARCCRLSFPLSSQDLDEGIIRWDYGEPYLNRQRESDHYCVHNDPDTHFCTVHKARPGICRTYTCTNDPRIWADYANRIPAGGIIPLGGKRTEFEPREFDLAQRMKRRQLALTLEASTLHAAYTDLVPRRGPAPPEDD
ncbi:MAG: YkgJ family cysteine cluster protein [Deltaproteobacteria bacterium]|nr:YkgJ family cysteine cluster protein [Deltaproteobacteria bacterium]